MQQARDMNQLINEIMKYTEKFRKEFPSLHYLLEEIPVTIPPDSQKDPKPDVEALANYLGTLKGCLREYKAMQKIKG